MIVPDFRSPKTGLYHNLARLDLPFAEAVFEIDYFKENPTPFYILAKELYPGKFSPTISHTFIALLAKKKLLRMLFTQNIDCLERRAGVPGELVVEAHGSFATQRCVECKTEYPDKEMLEHVEQGKAPHCIAGCGGLVKPDIVFFGEQLPSIFYENRSVPATADLMLVLGTSLTVHPFASLPMMAMGGVPRVLFNQERVGDMGTRPDDVVCLGDCDSGVRKLAKELGWEDELESMWRGVVGEEEAEKQIGQVQKPTDEQEDEVERLANEIEGKLDLSSEDEVGTNANRAAQVDVEEKAAKGSAEGKERSREGTSETEAFAKNPASGPARTSDKDLPTKPEITDSTSRAEEVATATKSDGLGRKAGVESQEPASYSTSVVTEPEETTQHIKSGGSTQ